MNKEELELLDYVFSLALGESYTDEYDEINSLKDKITRLNNIINELEKEIRDFYISEYSSTEEEIEERLKELKEGNNA